MHPYETTIAEYRKLLAFIERKISEIDLGMFRGCTEAEKAEFKRNAAIFRNKIDDLERKRDAARTDNRGESGPAPDEVSLDLMEETDALAKEKAIIPG